MLNRELNLDFQYPTYDVCVTRAQQAEKLACCDIEPSIFGNYVDVTHYAVETIMAAKHGGLSINGSVHVSQLIVQHAPIEIGEVLTLCGVVSAVESVGKGEMVTSKFELKRADGSVPLVLERTSLRADPERMGHQQKAKRTPPETPALQFISKHQLKPEQVARYSNEADNLIHSDVQVAQQFGFKAPIAGGLMAVRYMMAHLWQNGVVSELRMSANFRRPMFWDDQLNLHHVVGQPQHLVILRDSDQKVANDARVEHISYAS
jgi:hypothetical protein